MKKIYISGQISGLNESEFRYNFWEASDIINHKYGIDYINPLDLKPFLGIKCWLCYMITGLYHLRKCTHIALQSNWNNSRGAVIEYFFAKFIFKHQIIWL